MFAKLNTVKILLCDDNDNFRQLLTQYIHSMPGAEVIGEAIDGVDVIEKTESLNPDLVLMDLSMPNQSGLDATKTIKEKWPKKSVIILTLYEDSVYKELADEFHADGFIAKSSIKSQLPVVISELLNNSENQN
jgi:DNA-binding NarL/FixJ family response regulator